MDKFGQVNTLMKVATNSHTVGVPIDSLHNGGRPLVPLLDVIEKQAQDRKRRFGYRTCSYRS
jgi:hypothetical protein